MSDPEIVDQFLRGNPAAYECVVRWIREVVDTRVWLDGVSRDDIVGDTVIKLLHVFRADKFQWKASLKTYIQRITRFTIIDAVRCYERMNSRHLEYIQINTGKPPTPLSILEDKDEKYIFSRILMIMSEKCTSLWRMAFERGMSYKEIARSLQITESTVKTRMHRCKSEAIEIRKSLS